MKHLKKFEKIFESDDSEKKPTTRTPNLAKNYEKSIATLNKMEAKIAALKSQYKILKDQSDDAYVNALVGLGFEKKRLPDGDGDYKTICVLSIPGGTKFSNGVFQFKKDNWSGNKVSLSYKDRDVKDGIPIIEMKNLNYLKKVIPQFSKDPIKGLTNIRKILSTHGANEYTLKGFDQKVDQLKSNFFTGRKSSKDVKLMRPKEIMAKFKIPNVSSQYIQGKRSSVFDRDTHNLSDDMSFFKRFKEYYEKYGKPVKIDTEKFDSREDDYEYEASYRGEREWSYSVGTKVIVSFKDEENDRTITLTS